MKRFFNWLKALFYRQMDKVEDPEIMLDQARRDMQQVLIANREKAVQAIAAKNQLEGMIADINAKSHSIESRAAMALKQGDRDSAAQLMREKLNNDSTLAQLNQSLATANHTVEQVKLAIKREEQEVRNKAAEGLALKAQWKNAQIQNSIGKALEGLTFNDEFDSTYGRAKDKIGAATSEASARHEMLADSVAGKMMKIDDIAMDAEAHDALADLEKRLGLATPAAPATVETSADTQLADLENRLKIGG